MSILKDARAANAQANLNNKVAAYLNGEIKTPAIFTEKGLDKFIDNQLRLGTFLNQNEFITHCQAALQASAKDEANKEKALMMAIVKGDKKLEAEVIKQADKYQASLEALQQSIKSTLSKMITQKAVTKASTIKKEIKELVEA